MAAFTTRIMFGFAVILLFAITQASPDQRLGVLSSLYKKAAQEKRPLILVLDNSLKRSHLTGQSLDVTKHPHYSVKKQTPSLSKSQKLPYLLFQNLEKLRNRVEKTRTPISSLLYDKPHNQKNRIDINDWNRDGDDGYLSLRIRIKKNKKHGTRSQGIDSRSLRSAITLDILRHSNGNCVVEDPCDVKEDDCEMEVDCEEPQADSEECRFSDTCEEDNKQISTKGVLLNGDYV